MWRAPIEEQHSSTYPRPAHWCPPGFLTSPEQIMWRWCWWCSWWGRQGWWWWWRFTSGAIQAGWYILPFSWKLNLASAMFILGTWFEFWWILHKYYLNDYDIDLATSSSSETQSIMMCLLLRYSRGSCRSKLKLWFILEIPYTNIGVVFHQLLLSSEPWLPVDESHALGNVDCKLNSCCCVHNKPANVTMNKLRDKFVRRVGFRRYSWNTIGNDHDGGFDDGYQPTLCLDVTLCEDCPQACIERSPPMRRR